MKRYWFLLLGAFLLYLTASGFTNRGFTTGAKAWAAGFPTRELGSVAAIGDSITAAFNAAYSEFESCEYKDNPDYSFAANLVPNTTNSIVERAITYKGSGIAATNFGADGDQMSSGDEQARLAKAWALTQAAPRLITVFLGHNDICAGTKDRYQASCGRLDQDPTDYCRTSTFYYEQQVRQMLDVLVTIPDSQTAIIHPIRVSQICNFAGEKVIDEWYLTRRCGDLWATPNLFGQDGVCPSLTSCSPDRVADAYRTWVRYLEIAERVVAEYNMYGDSSVAGQTIPYNRTFATGNVVRASNVFLQTTNVLADTKFLYRNASGDVQLSVCECFHPSKYGQNLLADLIWNGVACGAASPCCNDNIVWDSDYNKGLCVNYTTYGIINGPWQILSKESEGVAAAGATLYGDFGPDGIHLWNGAAWSGITTSNPEAMAAADFLYGDFGALGVHRWSTTGWDRIAQGNPETMAASGVFLYGDFGPGRIGYGGIWQWNGAGWKQITMSNAESITAAGSMLYGDFGPGGEGYGGIWEWTDPGWRQITRSNPESITAAGSMLYGDFGPGGIGYGGIWQWNGAGWKQITMSDPEAIVASGSVLYGDFGPGGEGYGGIWEWTDPGWRQITRSNPESITATASSLYGDFGPRGIGYGGIWQWNGSGWYQLPEP